MLRKLSDFLRTFFFTPSMGYPLAVLRMVIAYMVIFETIVIFPNIDDLYGQFGYFQSHLMDALSGPSLPSFLAHLGVGDDSYSIFVRVLYLVHLSLGVLFLVGYRMRWTSIALWITQTMVVNSGYVSVYGVHRYLHNLVFLAMWMPMAHVWSVDRWRSREKAQPLPACTTGLRLVQIFILMTYIDAGYSKATGTDWWSGQAIWAALNLPEFNHFNFYWIAQYPWMAVVLSRATIFLETFYILGAGLPYVGKAWTLGIIGIHLGIAIFMGLTLFGSSLALVNVALFLVPLHFVPARVRVFQGSGAPVGVAT